MSDHKYRITYLVRPYPEGLPKSRIVEGEGACDAIIIHSVLFPEDGSRSEAIVSMDGRTGEDLDADELFKSWVMMANMLMEREELGTNKRALCSIVWTTVKQAILAVSGEEGSE